MLAAQHHAGRHGRLGRADEVHPSLTNAGQGAPVISVATDTGLVLPVATQPSYDNASRRYAGVEWN